MVRTPKTAADAKVAVLFVHGIGKQPPDFAAQFEERLRRKLTRMVRKAKMRPDGFPFEFIPVHWASIVDIQSDELLKRLNIQELSWKELREFVVSYLGDAIAYQRPAVRGEFIYDLIHQRLKACLREAAKRCGGEAPLCIISHSMGTVISHEFVKHLQTERSRLTSLTPLERGHTLTLFFTTGSPIPVWSLRVRGYGQPPVVPHPEMLARYPGLSGKWLNFYSKYDVLSYPLRQINDQYEQQVSGDIVVYPGNWLTRWTPLAHRDYWQNGKVIKTIAASLMRVWEQVSTGTTYGRDPNG